MSVLWILSFVSAPLQLLSQTTTPAVTVVLYNYAHLPDPLLRKAEHETSRIFVKVGVTLVWRTGVVARYNADNELEGHPASVLPVVYVHVLSLAMAARLDRPSEEFGFAIGSIAYVLFDRIDKFSEDTRTPDARGMLLGNVLGHEIGHIFLGPGHSPTGLMGAHWQAREYRASEHGVLVFTTRQGRLIRTRILAKQIPRD